MNRRHLVVGSVAVSALGASHVRAAQEATPAGSETCPNTTTADNTAVARRWYEEALTGHDLMVIDEIVATDSIHDSPSYPDLTNSRKVLEELLVAFPDMVTTVDQTVAEGDLVTVRWTMTATHGGEFLGNPPTGLPVTVSGLNLFRFECGRIVEVWSELNLLSIFQQIGLTFTPSGAATPTR